MTAESRTAPDDPVEGPDVPQRPRVRKSTRRILLKALLIVALSATGYTLLTETPLRQLTEYEAFESLIRSAGAWAPLAYVAAYIIGQVFVAPATLFSLVGAAVFGLGFGFLLITVGANVGAASAFLVGRWAGRDFVQARIRGHHRLERFSDILERHGFIAILFCRLLLAPFNLLNYIAGVSPVRFRHFVAGTFFGSIPVTFGLVFLGDTLARAWRYSDWSLLLSPRVAIAAAVFATCILVPVVILRLRSAKKKRTAES